MFGPIDRNPSRRTLLVFAWGMLIGFGVIGGVLWWRASGRAEAGSATSLTWLRVWAVGLWLVGAGMGLGTLGWPRAGRAMYVYWMTVTRPMGLVAGFVGLSLFYWLVLPLFSIVVRWSDPLRRRGRGVETYWEPCAPYESTLERMRRPF